VCGDDEGGGNETAIVLSSSVGVCDTDGEWSLPLTPNIYNLFNLLKPSGFFTYLQA